MTDDATQAGLSSRVIELADTLATYRARYRNIVIPPQLGRLEMAVLRRRHDVELLQEQVAELLERIDRLSGEITGYQRGYEALLTDTIERIRRQHQEGWSPTPVMGYRLWGWRDGGIHGAWQQWASPTKTATCRTGNDEVPHSDRRCGRLGCGVYATKDLESLLEEHTTVASHGYLAGLVELSGKVVEHDHGYRAAVATVVAAVLVGRERVLKTSDPDVIAEIFRRPDAAITDHGRPRTRTGWEETYDLLAIDPRSTAWTSESRSA